MFIYRRIADTFLFVRSYFLIRLTADINRDNYLDKAEFCLASHLAHLLGHRGLSLDDAVSACKPYISKIIRRLRKSEAKGMLVTTICFFYGNFMISIFERLIHERRILFLINSTIIYSN